MIATLQPYERIYSAALSGNLDVTGAKIALLADTYTFDATGTTWASISSHEIDTGDGYTTGGAALGGTITYAGGIATFDAMDVTWPNLAATFAHAVIYDPIAGGLVACLTFSGGNAITTTGYDFTIQWSASGIITARNI